MDRNDFVKLIGSGSAGSEYLPVAFLLRSGYACAGYYHPAINCDLSSTCVVLNAHLIELQGDHSSTGRPSIHDFNDFLEEIVTTFYAFEDTPPDAPIRSALYGKSIPLAAIPYDEIAVMYPVSHIGALMRRAEEMQSTLPPETQEKQEKKVPTFLDLDRSEIISLLRAKLW
jgi:hypothetical protein